MLKSILEASEEISHTREQLEDYMLFVLLFRLEKALQIFLESVMARIDERKGSSIPE